MVTAALLFVDQIAFNAVEDLDVVLFPRPVGFGEGLDYPMVSNGYRRVAQGSSHSYRIADIDDAIQTAHLGMKVELYALCGGIIL